jgi:4-hydroxy-3-polyprenylbenzoate decarboxylase
MAFSSFTDFLRALEKAGELQRIAEPVATELEITELADRQMKSPGGGKALLFEKPTIEGRPSPFPLAINAFGSEKRMAMSLGADSMEAAAAEMGALMQARPPASFGEAMKLLGTALELRHARPKTVGRGACQEVVTRLMKAKQRRRS